MTEQRMVPVELLESLLDDVGEPIYNADNYAKLRAIIDGPGVEPVAKWVKADYGNYPTLLWRANYVASIGDKLYLAAPSTPEHVVPDGWKEAATAWEVCASIHRQWAKGKDALFSTRQADFVRHADEARAMLASAPQPPATAQPSAVACPTDKEK